MGRKEKKEKQKDKKKKKKEKGSIDVPKAPIAVPIEEKKEIKVQSASIKGENEIEPKFTPIASETIEKYKKKLAQKRDVEKEFMEESKLHEELVLPKLKHKELKDDELITCPKCKQLTIVIEGRCSVCDFEIKK